MRLKEIFLLVSVFTGLIFISCSKKNDTPGPVTYTFSDTMLRSNVVPPFTLGGNGSLKATYNSGTKILQLTINYSGNVVTAVHLHVNAAGLNGPVLYSIGSSPFTFPIVFSTTALSAADEAELLNNNFYVDIHSTFAPAGDVRGQLIKR